MLSVEYSTILMAVKQHSNHNTRLSTTTEKICFSLCTEDQT